MLNNSWRATVCDNVKYIEERLEGMKVEVLGYKRSISMTTMWVRFNMFGVHLTIPLALGLFAVSLVTEGVLAALSNLIGRTA